MTNMSTLTCMQGVKNVWNCNLFENRFIVNKVIVRNVSHSSLIQSKSFFLYELLHYISTHSYIKISTTFSHTHTRMHIGFVWFKCVWIELESKLHRSSRAGSSKLPTHPSQPTSSQKQKNTERKRNRHERRVHTGGAVSERLLLSRVICYFSPRGSERTNHSRLRLLPNHYIL